MSLEDMMRAAQGKPLKERSFWERQLMTDEDGCVYDQQVATMRVPWWLGVLGIAVLTGMSWAEDITRFEAFVSKLAAIRDFAVWWVSGWKS